MYVSTLGSTERGAEPEALPQSSLAIVETLHARRSTHHSCEPAGKPACNILPNAAGEKFVPSEVGRQQAEAAAVAALLDASAPVIDQPHASRKVVVTAPAKLRRHQLPASSCKITNKPSDKPVQGGKRRRVKKAQRTVSHRQVVA